MFVCGLVMTVFAPSAAADLQVQDCGQPSNYSYQYNYPTEITADGSGNGWFADGYSAIGEVNQSCALKLMSPPTPGYIYGITTGPDGAVWYTEGYTSDPTMGPTGGGIGRIDPATGTVTEFKNGFSSIPSQITSGPDGNLWFEENFSIGKMTTSGTVTEYPVPVIPGGPPPTVGPDGNLWFVSGAPLPGAQIDKITPDGTVTQYPTGIPMNAELDGITAAPDGTVAFDGYDHTTGDTIVGEITTDGSTVTLGDGGLPPYTFPREMTTGPDGYMYMGIYSGMAQLSDGRIVLRAETPIMAPIENQSKPFQVGANKVMLYGSLKSGDVAEITGTPPGSSSGGNPPGGTTGNGPGGSTGGTGGGGETGQAGCARDVRRAADISRAQGHIHVRLTGVPRVSLEGRGAVRAVNLENGLVISSQVTHGGSATLAGPTGFYVLLAEALGPPAVRGFAGTSRSIELHSGGYARVRIVLHRIARGAKAAAAGGPGVAAEAAAASGPTVAINGIDLSISQTGETVPLDAPALTDLFPSWHDQGARFVEPESNIKRFVETEQRLSDEGRLSAPFQHHPLTPQYEIHGHAHVDDHNMMTIQIRVVDRATGIVKALVDGHAHLRGRPNGHRWGKGQIEWVDGALKLLKDTLAELKPPAPPPC